MNDIIDVGGPLCHKHRHAWLPWPIPTGSSTSSLLALRTIQNLNIPGFSFYGANLAYLASPLAAPSLHATCNYGASLHQLSNMFLGGFCTGFRSVRPRSGA